MKLCVFSLKESRFSVCGLLRPYDTKFQVAGSKCTSQLTGLLAVILAQEKAEGEPKVKKEKKLLDDNDDGEEDHEKGDKDESLEEVQL